MSHHDSQASEHADKPLRKARKAADKAGLPQLNHHVFMCVDDKCCSKERSHEAWRHLKHRLKELGLDGNGIQRTPVKCLDICKAGPICVVYPQGTWYAHCDPPVLDRIIDEHLLGGNAVEEHVIVDLRLTR